MTQSLRKQKLKLRKNRSKEKKLSSDISVHLSEMSAIMQDAEFQASGKKLFILKRADNSTIKGNNNQILAFPNKMLAKKFRDKINNLLKNPVIHVSKGPEHVTY